MEYYKLVDHNAPIHAVLLPIRQVFASIELLILIALEDRRLVGCCDPFVQVCRPNTKVVVSLLT